MVSWGKMQGVPNARKRAERLSYPIHGYVGPNGSGKSLCMVWDTIPTLDAGIPVLSTVRLLDFRNPRPCEGCDPAHLEVLPWLAGQHDRGHMQAHPMWVPLGGVTAWETLLSWSFGDVLLDEVAGVASSRQSAGMPYAVEKALQQLRRGDIVVRWSAPAWARADKIAREVSQAVTYSEGRMGVVRVEEDGRERRWATRRLFCWKTYDATQFEDFTVGKRAELPILVKDWHWGPGSPAFAAYDTFSPVADLGAVNEGGRCYRCGGTRRAPACKCDAPAAPLWSAGAVAPASAEREDADAPTVPRGARMLDLVDADAS